ncbi:hypothetical protein MUK42_28278 [Musa troglodytarum]|uniref:Phosphatidylinositol N-acetyglucosaminlytransferase subunit P-related n=1 Tax=Musa troglodytarum TaxID=320322 RepID=A0A9E7FQL8_9LILI|nr:hypothetical protein MUK42_28278 [Musa troglodytarum]
MDRSKLLTERPQRDVIRNCSHAVTKPIYPVEMEIEGKQIISEQRISSPNKKSGGTTIKMLMAQEIYDETESRHNPPNVVARLMGLDSTPFQQSVTVDGKMRNNDYLCNGLTREFQHHQQQECEIRSFSHEKDSRDVYEVWQQPSKNILVKEQSPQKVKYDENSYQRRMTLVQKKFMQAKQLATDGKLIDSKEFRDAVEVLNSNRDLFLKFLEKPNSLFKKSLFEHQSFPLPSLTTSVPVLKPSNTMERKGNKGMARQLLRDSDGSVRKVSKHFWSSSLSEPKGQNLHQQTRIVVLKPSLGKPYNTKTKLSNNSPTMSGGQNSTGALATDELVSSRETSKGITCQMGESLNNNIRDEAMFSSTPSNGYIGDENSFNRSDGEDIEDEVGSLSDSVIASPATVYSCDYIKKIEAKKRLSERWALVASSVNSQEQTQLRRTSSTLSEVLAIPEINREGSQEDLAHSSSKLSSGVDDLKALTFSSTFETTYEDARETFHRNLTRSKSVPTSPSACEIAEFNGEISSSLIGKLIVQPEVPKSNKKKSSFKNKVSKLFFSKSKKSSGQKPLKSPSVGDDQGQSSCSNSSDTRNDYLLPSVNDTLSARIKLVSTDRMSHGSTEKTPFRKGVLSLGMPGTFGDFVQSQDQSCQISFSETPLVDHVNNGLLQSSGSIIAECPQALSRSPPIGSVARSLSWSSTYLDITSATTLKPSVKFSKADEEHEQYVFVDKLISSVGMDDNKSTIYGGWHSLDSPLNPSLLYESLQIEDEEDKCRERQSRWRLLFDFVNAALLDISRSILLTACPWNTACYGPRTADTAGTSVAEVWSLVRNKLSGDIKSSNGGIVVDWLVKEEVGGRQWTESRWLEGCELSKEISEKVLEELVEEAVCGLSCN